MFPPWKLIGGAGIQLPSFLFSALVRGKWPTSHPVRFLPGEEPIEYEAGDSSPGPSGYWPSCYYDKFSLFWNALYYALHTSVGLMERS
jgi:hypothetical protein